VVQYYFTDKQALLNSGLTELAARLDHRVKARAAADVTGTTRGLFDGRRQPRRSAGRRRAVW